MRDAAKRKLQLGPRVAVELGLSLSAALDHAHNITLPDGIPLRLVHRDVSPGNVLITPDGIIKLVDFGVVKSAVNLNSTVAGMVKGKFSYMSPEQIGGRQVDHRADLFSLGILLYEVCTGRRLFRREDVGATLMAVAEAEIPRPIHLDTQFPPELERILLKALERDPDARYQTARDLGADLETFRESMQWRGGGQELSRLVNLFAPPDSVNALPNSSSQLATSNEDNTARAQGSSHVAGMKGTSSGTASIRIRGSLRPVGVRKTLSLMLAPVPPPPVLDEVGAARPRQHASPSRWPIPVALAAAIVGSAVFWFSII
jgi:eukaryotic-like serine/threonine-protein kinase